MTRPLPEVPGVTHRFAEAGDVRLHVAVAGDGSPVVLLHSFPQHWYTWRNVIPGLAADRRVFAPDFRGAGWSDAPRTGYDTTTRVDDLLHLLDALGLERVDVVSHGWGAWAAFFLSLRAPDRVATHLALNMTHPWPARRALRTQAWRFWYTALWEIPLLGPAMLRHWPALTRFLLRRWGTTSADALEEFVADSRLPAHARAGQALNWRFVTHDIPRLRCHPGPLTVPTEILLGRHDIVIPPALPAGATPPAADLRVRILDGCGHLIPEQRPDVVVAAALSLRSRRDSVTSVTRPSDDRGPPAFLGEGTGGPRDQCGIRRPGPGWSGCRCLRW
ncbi:alpha/beta fold hydrolase [Amycolatopsis sp. FDAARGOS 1241]|uniref:alpha/beta fold hydrolase n=1 Tax=Amycolatopsis sp. FDAARGOS 1241 TaxID=2778070 RepID=UPI001952029F|nr:alpha/beta hydrolase [Amycolatopsis sp. FDAARGOS 1241]QRP44526.1 alpha/beta hydrolase [Amycolatopsis sp. FDAARGOS 1241]